MSSNNAITFSSTIQRRVVLKEDLLTIGDVFAFVVPLLQIVELKMGGSLLGADLIIVAVLPIALLRHWHRLKQKPIPLVLMLGWIWFAEQVVTDVVRESAPEEFMRGWMKIAFVLANFIVVWTVICVSRRRFLLYGFGLAIGTMVALYLHPTEDSIISPWKFGVAVPMTMLVALIAGISKRFRIIGVLIPLCALAVLHVYKDCRILAVIALLSAIYSLFLMAQKRQQLGGLRRVLLVLLVIAAVGGFASIYNHYAREGAFGKYAQQKTEAQSAGEGGALLGGRREILASSQAILDSPILGHGSWAKDPQYSALLQQRSDDLGYKRFQGGKLDDLIPTHSYIFGSWVDGGIAGGIFWLYILIYTLYTTFNATGKEPLLPFFAFAGMMLTWDILFSPLGTPTRFVAPFFVAAVILFRRFQTNPIEYEWES